MNRTIKFRGRKSDGEWVYGYFLVDGEQHLIFQYGSVSLRPTGIYTGTFIDPSTVGQFTGLLDKDGKEIYEGDVIHTTTIYGFHGELLREWKELKKLDSLNDIGSLFEGIVVCDVQRGLMLKRLDNDYAEPLFSRKYNNHCHIEMSLCSIIGNIHDNPELLK